MYGIGFGQTTPNVGVGAIPQAAARVISGIAVLLNGTPVDGSRILYAGVTPGSAGLYQVNLVLPDAPGTDPEIRVAMGPQTSRAGLLLAVR